MAAPRTPAFRGRARERKALDDLVGRVRDGESAVLVIRGEAGIGKTALMRYCARQASGCQLVQIDGVQSEMELPLAALHQLCTPMLSCLPALPEPQQHTLRVAFGLAAEPAPDRFVLGLAVLSLLAENAAERPLICLVDDAQWLDEASSQVLGFVGRRLLAEPVGLLFAVREAAGERLFPGVPALTVEGLTDDDARALLTAAVPGHLDNRVRDRIVAETAGNPLGLLELARGMSEAGREAPVLLMQAAERLETLDAELARETYLYAWVASHLAGPLAGPGGLLLEVSRAAQAAPQPAGAPRPCDLLLDGLTRMIVQGRAAAEPTIRRAVSAFLGDQVSGEEWLQWGIFAQMAAMAAWDFDSWVALSARHVELARALGALAPLSIALNGRGSVATHCGDFETATSLAAEKDVVNEVTGIRQATTCDLLLAGYRGRPAEAVPLFTATMEDSTVRGEGLAVQMANWSAAVLHSGLGRYAEALAVAEPATEETYSPLSTQLVLPELIEAAVRTRRADLAREALGRLSAMTTIEGSDWAKGLEARSRALVSEGREAEQCYAEAVERLGRTPLRLELARAHLLYGEWLRRENRRLDARHQLHAAYHLLDATGAEAFSERARRELLATGEKVRSLVPHWGHAPSCPCADQCSVRARCTKPRRDHQAIPAREGDPHALVVHRPRRPRLRGAEPASRDRRRPS